MKRPLGPSCRDDRMIRLRCRIGVWVSWWRKFTGMSPWMLHRHDGTVEPNIPCRQSVKESGVERPKAAIGAGLPSLAEREDSVTLSLFPTLNGLLSDPNWPDATLKGKLCLMLFVDETSVRVLLKLEDDKLKTSTAARTIDDVLTALEKMLATGQVVWEQDTGGAYKSRKKGK